MFKNLQQNLGKVINQLRGQARLTESNIKDTLREVRLALLEADVALPVVKELIEQIRNQAIGKKVLESLTPGQTLIKIVYEKLVQIMGEANEQLNLATQPPAVILMAGLQGSGKTTSVAKLARWLKEKHKKSVMVVSCDVYRPAAIDQLQTLASEVNATFYPSHNVDKPEAIATAALKEAKLKFADVLIVDTAGRLHIDAAMMNEIKSLHTILNPIETMFVVDAMTGQDAANTAKAFHEAIPLTGVILTKTDGDARGGAALSIRHITGKPIKFLGVGERSVALEPFHPDRIASRILGMGDVLSLVEEVQASFDQDKVDKLTDKIRKGKKFDLTDFKMQLEQMTKMGGLKGLMEKMPEIGQMTHKNVQTENGDREVIRMIAIINSMTLKERAFPDTIKASHKLRIAAGSGTKVQEINRMLKQFNQAQKLLKKFKNIAGMQNMLGKFVGGQTPRKRM
ncbi:signal recognition particle [Achromatium sp. WMS3]|nr:signal recognition particle [Achromatium sp. WMS3]